MHHFKDTSNSSTGSFHSQQTAQTPLKTREQPLRKKYKLASGMWCFSFLQKVIQKMLPLPLHSWNLWSITSSLQFSAPTVVLAEPLLQAKVTVFVIHRQPWAAWGAPGEQECFGMRGLQRKTPLPSLQESQYQFTPISSFICCGKWSLTLVKTKSHRRQWWINEVTFLHELIAKTILWNHKQH